MKRVSLVDGWLTYMDMAVPKDAPPIQLKETKRAFYAGASFMLIVGKELGEPHVSEELGVQLLERLWRESLEFKEATARGEQ